MASTNTDYAAFGSIAFGKDSSNNVVAEFNDNQWVNISRI